MAIDQLVLFMAVGFAAQLVDGAIGMAYGITSTAILLSFGTLPATASASVHAAEVCTTAASGIAHWRFRNVDFALFRRLALPGMVGGALGAYGLAKAPAAAVQPVINGYLFVMGGIILLRALRQAAPATEAPPRVRLLGLVGGFLDAVGGGGWGPIVTSTLVGQGTTPRLAIGSTNLAEFFVTLIISATFVTTIGLELWPIIAGLILGGILAAPLAAFAAQKLPDRPLMILVGAIILLLSLRGLLRSFT